jgi:crotonobetainyl-CoA:carnitine CoA-transferase CaiB-like acyl-CoA transferase
MQPLTGVTVLDFTRYLAGPYCTMILGDYGADVVKIEHPATGDDSRRSGPFVNGESYSSCMPNRNKRSLALDLKSEDGLRIARELVAGADVVVENFRPGVMARLGLDYEAAHAVNPEIIYCSVTGFGQTGPNAHRAGFDIIAQGMAGFLRMTGEPGGEPAKFGVAINDLVAGMTAASAVLAAYIRRLREGGGQYIDVALVDAGLALTVWEAGAWFGEGIEPVAEGSRHRLNAPYQAFRTSDGYVTVGANNEKLWRSFCLEVIERPELLDRPEYQERGRVAHVEQLAAELQAILSTRPTAHWVAALDRAGVPGGPVLSYSEALAQPQVGARDMVVEVDHPVIGRMRALGMPAKLSETPATIRLPAPLLGQHTRDVLRSAGYPDAQIDDLLARGVVTDRAAAEAAPERGPDARAQT